MGSQSFLELLRINPLTAFLGFFMICFAFGSAAYYGKSYRIPALIILTTGTMILLSGLTIEIRINGGQSLRIDYIVDFLTFAPLVCALLYRFVCFVNSHGKHRSMFNGGDQWIDPAFVDDDRALADYEENSDNRNDGVEIPSFLKKQTH